MIIAVDIETAGLDATKFLQAALVKPTGKPKIYYDKQQLWHDIIKLGKAEAKRRKTLTVYSHNASYDFYGYADLSDPNITFFSTRPFIAGYRGTTSRGKQKDIIKFLDTYGIWKMKLKDLGTLLDMPKYDTPPAFLTGLIVPKTELIKNEPYVIRDADICLQSVLWMRKQLNEDKIPLRRLFTINQIAVNYLVNWLKQQKNTQHIFYNKKQGMLIRPVNLPMIHAAYKAGRVEAFKTGDIASVNYIDCNSLYPYAASEMRFPDLRTERTIQQPLTVYTPEKLFSKIGVSRCLLQNTSCTIGLLAIRTAEESYYPKIGTYILGTWTHGELALALKSGYKLIDIEQSVIWDDGENLLKPFMEHMYYKRYNCNTPIATYLYKAIMNGAIGKLAQTRINQEFVIDSVEAAEKYLAKQYEIIKGIDTSYLYKKKPDFQQFKKYYCPIIPALINAQARIYMYHMFSAFHPTQLVYTDTDSILYTGITPNQIPHGKNIGEFKFEHVNERAIIYGKKTYLIGQEMKVSGIRKTDITPEQFEKGYIEYREMTSIKTQTDMQLPGSFTKESRDLKQQHADFLYIQDKLHQEPLLIDYDIENVSYFSKYFKDIPEKK